jgi:hypothetical protein
MWSHIFNFVHNSWILVSYLLSKIILELLDEAVEYALYHVCCCLRMQIIWHAALSSSHDAMRCCHHSEIIQNVLERKDSMAVLPTGFGKSMCYVPPSHFGQGKIIYANHLPWYIAVIVVFSWSRGTSERSP